VVQRLVTVTHHRFFDRGLPTKAGIYLHCFHREDYAAFRKLVEFFREAGYRVAEGPDDHLADPSERTLWLSFDDNTRDWYEALDFFDRLDVRATFYVNTGVFRDEAPPDVLYRYADALGDDAPERTLSVAELKALRARGHVIGAHTHTHPVLTDLPLDEAVTEIRLSKEILEAHLGEPIEHFSYPYGMRRFFSDDLLAVCQGLGFRTVARAAAGCQHAEPHPIYLERSLWECSRPLRDNLRNLRVDGRLFEALTGRSAVT